MNFPMTISCTGSIINSKLGVSSTTIESCLDLFLMFLDILNTMLIFYLPMSDCLPIRNMVLGCVTVG